MIEDDTFLTISRHHASVIVVIGETVVIDHRSSITDPRTARTFCNLPPSAVRGRTRRTSPHKFQRAERF